MKIAIVGNIPLPDIADRIGANTPLGGWLISITSILKTYEDIEIVYCFPQNRTRAIIDKVLNGIHYYGVKESLSDNKCHEKLVEDYKYILNRECPDVVHVFGTEYAHALAIIETGYDISRVVVSIQGIAKAIGDSYCVGLPEEVAKAIEADKNDFLEKGKNEYLVLKKIKNVEGRTDFDKAYMRAINKDARYFHCNRILRESFYGRRWIYDNCDKNTIFLSQASYPVKGMHLFVRALNIVKREYPDVRVRVGGSNVYAGNSSNQYIVYVKNLIKEYGLEENIEFLGLQNESNMVDNYLKANIFVMPSVIENSPNSLSEAMILGLPCVAADVGGAAAMISHNIEGRVYRTEEINLLAYHIMDLFDNSDLAIKYGSNSRIRALKDYDKGRIIKSVLDMYKEIALGKNYEMHSMGNRRLL